MKKDRYMQFDIAKMMEQAKQMQAKLEDARKKAESEEITAEAGGGMVEVTMNGTGKLKKINIDKALINPEDPEMLQDLVVAAVNKAHSQIEGLMSSQMGGLADQLPNIPGFNF